MVAGHATGAALPPWSRALAAALAAALGTCTKVPPRPGDGGTPPPDLRGHRAEPPDLPIRTPWRTINPTPEDSHFVALAGTSEDDHYLLTPGALLRRRDHAIQVAWRAPVRACLRGLHVLGQEVVVSGGCHGVGLLLVRRGEGAFELRELPNVELGGVWIVQPGEAFIASPSAGLLRLHGQEVSLERTVAPGDVGTGPVAVWGSGRDEVYAVGNGRILHRRPDGQWEVERSSPGERQLAIWGAGPDDLYVAGSSDRGGTIWHRSGPGTPFQTERMEGVSPRAVVSLWGNGRDEVYAAADSGLVLRRDPRSGIWLLDRPASPDQPGVRALWGAAPQHLLAAGPGALLSRQPGPRWQVLVGQVLTSVALRAVALSAPGEGLAVGDAGVVLRQHGGQWSHEARGLTTAPLYGVAVAADGTAQVVGAGVALRRDRSGTWSLEPTDGGTLRAVALLPDGDAYAVGDEGRVLRRRGGLWQPEPPIQTSWGPLRATLRAVALLPDGTVAVAGDEATLAWRPPGAASFLVLRRDPSSGLSFTGLGVLPGPGGPRLVACARGGAILVQLEGGTLVEQQAPLVNASALYGTGPDDIYLAGQDGSVWHWNGWRWSPEPTPPGEPLLALAGSGQTVVAVGEQGFMIER
ncbi:MAG: hypothetical protein RMK29_08190 [Myxococcales bacterium]|nr:hypothetical protein [Myxococcales bacterium]